MTFFSICITKANGDVPLAFLQASGIWLNDRALKGAFALERGHQKRQLHVQGFAAVHAPASKQGGDLVTNSIKVDFPVPGRCGYKVQAKSSTRTKRRRRRRT